MANIDLRVGDLVMLSPDTRWNTSDLWNPLNEVGEVVFIYTDGGVYVKWESYDGGVRYSRGDSDLILQSPQIKFKTREGARKAKKGTDLIIVDMGLEEEYRWLLTVKEV